MIAKDGRVTCGVSLEVMDARLERMERLLKVAVLGVVGLALLLCLVGHRLHVAKTEAEMLVAEARAEVMAFKAQFTRSALHDGAKSLMKDLMGEALATLTGEVSLLPSDPIGVIVDNIVRYDYSQLVVKAHNITSAYQKTQRYANQFDEVYNTISLLASIFEKAAEVEWLKTAPVTDKSIKAESGDIALNIKFPLFDYLVDSFDPVTLASLGADCVELADRTTRNIDWSGAYPTQGYYPPDGYTSWDANNGIRMVIRDYIHPICSSLAALDTLLAEMEG
ncbi:uncharacterized protein AMSG_08954 [Thecamonas trahens ATCC 50062]|uniref:Uncharacterized protein n=1 Tax=Thecamonas trahens ATCC 50062 TaxID=461836 RepID=A0A0L0DMA9_THETB|nr:hypothetical protein AMSG_08954 [Thecamonas trahens ATCC 50062]KNC53447.1 hypothetical protein AMSG_08954 [Thecamonas trahens ATCC 50062]|eukprot:XP_013754482.1 hypothetical protein AMSG_08954 [Thecamonas trahens ATCC 50062]